MKNDKMLLVAAVAIGGLYLMLKSGGAGSLGSVFDNLASMLGGVGATIEKDVRSLMGVAATKTGGVGYDIPALLQPQPFVAPSNAISMIITPQNVMTPSVQGVMYSNPSANTNIQISSYTPQYELLNYSTLVQNALGK